MSTGAARNLRAGRAWRRVRLTLLLDLILFAPAILLLVRGAYTNQGPTLTSLACIGLVTIAIVRWGISGRTRPDEIELAEFLGGLAALTAVFAAVEQARTFGLDLYPVVYALIAFVVAFSRWRVGLGLTATAIGFEWVLWIAAAGGLQVRDWQTVLSRSLWILVFASLHLAFNAVSRTRRQARPSHRVQSDDSPSGMEEEPSDLVGRAVLLVKRACHADSVALLQLQAPSAMLQVTASTEAAHRDRQVDAKAGIPGNVIRSGQTVVANDLKRDLPGTLPTADGSRPQHLMAAPVRLGSRPSGVLLTQRTTEGPFDQGDIDALNLSVSLIDATLKAQRAVQRVSEAHYELERFFEASRLLNSALTPDDVYRSANQALHMITDFELLAITWIEQTGGSHRIVHASGSLAGDLEGQAVDPDRTLCAMVIKNRHYLPLGCEVRPGTTAILRSNETLQDVRSLVVLPLRLHDRIAGTLTIGSTERHLFNDNRRGMFEVIANQVAVSLANAKVYARVQELATMDALTGLFNRRSFQQRLDEAHARALRSKNPLSVVVLDIDHFKKVNDTHGHPVGDEVLARLGQTIGKMFRRTDTAARYGGEEFAVILEDTNAEGAMVMAERLRQTAGELTFVGEGGRTFGITLSLGLASYPRHSENPSELFELADQALYRAKRGGRNQTRLARGSRARKSRIAPTFGSDPSRACAP